MTIWEKIKKEAEEVVKKEDIFTEMLTRIVLTQKNFKNALIINLADKCLPASTYIDLEKVIEDILLSDENICTSALYDLVAIMERDPAATECLYPFLFYKGYHALQLFRVSHSLWKKNRIAPAFYIQSFVSRTFGVDIHPAAEIGNGIFIDHATGVVIGETSVIEDNVSLLHGVTLGGTGRETGKRHPTVRKNCLIGTDSSIIGNIELGEGSVIGAGSVVLHDVPSHTLAAGVPAKNKGIIDMGAPSKIMDQIYDSYRIDNFRPCAIHKKPNIIRRIEIAYQHQG